MKTLRLVFFIVSMQGLWAGDEVSRYQEMVVAEKTGKIQLQFPYNINIDYVATSTTGSGSITQSNNFAQIASGAATSSSATLQSNGRLNHQAGQGCTCIFGGQFTIGVANNTQIVGIGNSQDGLFFGYNGTSFGILYRRNSVDTWTAQASWSGDTLDGTGPSGITLNSQNGNVYKIDYQGIGFGSVKFYIEHPTDGTWILVHTIQYPNSAINTLFLNSSLRLYAASTNTTNTSNVTIFISSIGASIAGQYDTSLQCRNSAANAGVALTTAYNNIVGIRNDGLYNGVAGEVLVHVDRISIFQIGANPVEFTLFLNPAVTASSFTPSPNNSNSVVSVDTSGTTVIAGNPNFGSFFLADNQRFRQFYFLGNPIGAPFQNDEDFDPEEYTFDLSGYDIVLTPGDRLVVAARTITGTGTGYASLSWNEKF